MNDDRFDRLLSFIHRLGEAKIHYELAHNLDDAISVEIRVPGEYWEVDFWADGDVYVERFRSNGHIDEASALEELFERFSDKEEPVTQDGNARK